MDLVVECKLTNAADHDVFGVLIGASMKKASALQGRVLAVPDFLAETGGDVIAVTGVPEAGLSLSELNEFLEAFGGTITGIQLCAETSPAQEKVKLIERAYMPVSPDMPFAQPVQASVMVGQDDNEGFMVHVFAKPFVVAPNKSLVMPVLAGQTVCIKLSVSINPTPTLSY